MSCKKAQKYFEDNKIEVNEIADARKEKIDSSSAWKLISGQQRVFIGKGKKVLVFEPGDDNREDILKAAMGRSGNLRAPTLKTKDKLLIGYNEDIYSHL